MKKNYLLYFLLLINETTKPLTARTFQNLKQIATQNYTIQPSSLGSLGIINQYNFSIPRKYNLDNTHNITNKIHQNYNYLNNDTSSNKILSQETKQNKLSPEFKKLTTDFFRYNKPYNLGLHNPLNPLYHKQKSNFSTNNKEDNNKIENSVVIIPRYLYKKVKDILLYKQKKIAKNEVKKKQYFTKSAPQIEYPPQIIIETLNEYLNENEIELIKKYFEKEKTIMTLEAFINFLKYQNDYKKLKNLLETINKIFQQYKFTNMNVASIINIYSKIKPQNKKEIQWMKYHLKLKNTYSFEEIKKELYTFIGHMQMINDYKTFKTHRKEYYGELYAKNPTWGYRAIMTFINTAYTLINGQKKPSKKDFDWYCPENGEGICASLNPINIKQNYYKKSNNTTFYKNIFALDITEKRNIGFAFDIKDYTKKIISPKKNNIIGLAPLGLDHGEIRVTEDIKPQSIKAIIISDKILIKNKENLIQELLINDWNINKEKIDWFFNNFEKNTEIEAILKIINSYYTLKKTNSESELESESEWKEEKNFKDSLKKSIHRYYTKKFGTENYDALDIINDYQNVLAHKYRDYKKLNVYNIDPGNLIMTAEGKKIKYERKWYYN